VFGVSPVPFVLASTVDVDSTADGRVSKDATTAVAVFGSDKGLPEALSDRIAAGLLKCRVKEGARDLAGRKTE